MEKLQPIQPYMVTMTCDKCGDGEMTPSGNIALLSDPPQFPHTCNKCGHQHNYRVRYPTIRYK